MLTTQLRRLARDPSSGFVAVDSGVEGAGFDADDGTLAEAGAEVVEDGPALRAIPVGAPAPSGFSAFLDGIQRAAVRLYHGPVPVVHAYAAAVVRIREAGRLRTRYQEEREALFFPFQLLDPALLEAAGVPRVQLMDTGPETGEPLPLFPPLLHARASRRINHWREELEAGLARRWCQRDEGPGWLLVDGSLTLSPELSQCPRAAGVIKSHRTRFFDGDDARVLLSLRAGERTSVFRPGTREFTPVHSWYLRLRPATGRDIFWGLVRVEAAASDMTVHRASEISRWLLAETAPLSLPDARWDRLLYPIHDCEVYLRARAPNP